MSQRIMRAMAVGASVALLLASIAAGIEGRSPERADAWQAEKLDRDLLMGKAPR